MTTSLSASHALARVVHGAAVGKQHALKAGADPSLGQKVPRLLVDLDHGRHVEQLDGPAKIVERIQVERRILGDKLDIVE
jgi:hypothetical protein